MYNKNGKINNCEIVNLYLMLGSNIKLKYQKDPVVNNNSILPKTHWHTETCFIPTNKYVGDSCPLNRAVAAKGKARLAMDVLRIANIWAIIALIYGHVYPSTFRVRLENSIQEQ